jgi:transposase
VCAPGKTERAPADRVKTDERDAIRLARLLAAGELTLVTIPAVEREQLRDLVRCREDIRVDLMGARHRVGKFLLRREILLGGARGGVVLQAPPVASVNQVFGSGLASNAG